MDRHLDRADATWNEREYELVVDRERARFAAWYEFFPRSGVAGRHGTFARRREPARARRRHGLRRRLPAADPSDRPGAPQGPQQRADVPAGRAGQPVGDRRRRGRARRRASRPRHAGRLRPVRRAGARARPGSRPRLRHPVLARSSLRARAPRVVLPPARRHDQVRGEPAQEVPGRLSGELLRRGSAAALGGDAAARRVLDRPRGDALPRGQPAHQAGALLGVADPRGADGAPRGRLPGRGLHAAQDDEGPGQGRLHPVLHLLHVAQRQGRAGRVPARRSPSRRWPSTSAATCGPTRRTSCTRRCSTAAGRPSGCVWCWPPRCPRSTGSTAATSWARTRRSRRAPRST